MPMSDELPTAARVSDPGIRALYRLENRWQAWLDVEAALAKSQEELGIIPHGAAAAIGRAAHLELLDRARIDEGFARTGHTIVPLVWELSRVTGEPYGGWVHWGQQRRTSRRPAIYWYCGRRTAASCA
jgi:3-carboxy-cis,cis-muconate cycloisomerase